MNDTSSSLSATTQASISHDAISRHAQALWEKSGRPSGRDEEIWLEAERNLRARRASTPPAAAATEAPAAGGPATGPATPPSPPAARPARAGGATATPRMPGSHSRAKV